MGIAGDIDGGQSSTRKREQNEESHAEDVAFRSSEVRP